MMDRLRLNRLQLYGVVSSTCFAWAIINAFRVRSNFYSAAVYLSKSNACMMVSHSSLPASSAFVQICRYFVPSPLETDVALSYYRSCGTKQSIKLSCLANSLKRSSSDS